MPPQDGTPNKDTNLGSMQRIPLRNATALVAGRRVKLHFSQRRWSLAEGKSEASLFSMTLVVVTITTAATEEAVAEEEERWGRHRRSLRSPYIRPSFSLSPSTVGRSAKTTAVRKMRICHEASQECGCSGVGRWPKTRAKLRFSQRRWSLAKGKSEASLFSLL
uniref:Uncharacterized protein n=1 Tax=Musa acuminata subsp. malaccensis TaxID=214687 RepID=A0A804HMY6_MUSAM